MSRAWPRSFHLAAVAALVLTISIRVAPAADPTTLPPAPPVPAVPEVRSPVDLFRELLALSPAERRLCLTNRSEVSQKLILAKVREYESLRPDVRELRLKATELRWHLLPLLSTPPTNRPVQLAHLSPEDRRLVEDRLAAWDKLPAKVQEQLLANEATVRYFAEAGSAATEQQRKLLEGMSEARRQKLQAGIAEWQALPEEQRRKITASFSRFFELTAEEKQRALNTLSAAERQQIERTLKAFESLRPDQRARCLRSFEKFASLSLEERQLFLKNAERWKLMSPDERQAWRDLVAHVNLLPPIPVSLPPRPSALRLTNRPAAAPPMPGN